METLPSYWTFSRVRTEAKRINRETFEPVGLYMDGVALTIVTGVKEFPLNGEHGRLLLQYNALGSRVYFNVPKEYSKKQTNQQ